MKIELKEVISQLTEAICLNDGYRVSALVDTEAESIIGWCVVKIGNNGNITQCSDTYRTIKDLLRADLSEFTKTFNAENVLKDEPDKMSVKDFIEKYCIIDKDRSVLMNGCYLTLYSPNESGEYTFDDKLIKFFIDHGITTVESYRDFSDKTDSRVACIGFSETEHKWYGWSHRAMCGFGIGYVAKTGDSCTTSGWTKEYLDEHPEADLSVPVGFVVNNMCDARRCAIAFAESVS